MKPPVGGAVAARGSDSLNVPPALLRASDCYLLESDWNDAVAPHVEFVCGPGRHVDQQPRADRATIVDRHHDGTPVIEIGHLDQRMERQGTVGGVPGRPMEYDLEVKHQF